MLLIDFKATPRTAFFRGFLRGLAAPVMLFENFDGPRIPAIQQIVPPCHFATIGGDWAKIGNDIRNATTRYGKEAAAAK